MEFKKSKLKTVRNALKIAVMYAKTECYIAEFKELLIDVESEIIKESKQDKTIKNGNDNVHKRSKMQRL